MEGVTNDTEGKGGCLIYLAIYRGVGKEWEFDSLVDVMKWLFKMTGELTCLDAIQVGFMLDLNRGELERLSMFKDFYLAQFDGRLVPKIDMDRLYEDVVAGRVESDYKAYLRRTR